MIPSQDKPRKKYLIVIVYLLGLTSHRMVGLQLFKWLKTFPNYTFLIVDRWISGFLSLQQTDIYKYIHTHINTEYIHSDRQTDRHLALLYRYTDITVTYIQSHYILYT